MPRTNRSSPGVAKADRKANRAEAGTISTRRMHPAKLHPQTGNMTSITMQFAIAAEQIIRIERSDDIRYFLFPVRVTGIITR